VREDASTVKVHTTEVVKKSLNPFWKPFELPLQVLCNGDKDRPIKVKCFDWNKNADSELIGELEFTVNQLIKDAASVQIALIHSKFAASKRNYRNSGIIFFEKAEIVIPPSFLDYIEGGCQISLMVAIDYTGSNGDPSEPKSLHYRNPNRPDQQNPYQKAICSIGDILAPYDSDGLISAWGFGGKMRKTEQVSHDFALTFRDDPEVRGVDGVLNAYNRAFDQVLLSGPTYFAPVIAAAGNQIAKQGFSQNNQQYAILLIITDGAINDFTRAWQVIQRAAQDTPLSIVIVGVGDADFGAMQQLDGDDVKDSTGVHRDIVQFVPMNKFAHSHISELAKEVLAEIPSQFMSFMKLKNITPNPPIQKKPGLLQEDVKSYDGPPKYEGGEGANNDLYPSAPSPFVEAKHSSSLPFNFDTNAAPPYVAEDDWQLPPPKY
jgi:hypothetical protein